MLLVHPLFYLASPILLYWPYLISSLVFGEISSLVQSGISGPILGLDWSKKCRTVLSRHIATPCWFSLAKNILTLLSSVPSIKFNQLILDFEEWLLNENSIVMFLNSILMQNTFPIRIYLNQQQNCCVQMENWILL